MDLAVVLMVAAIAALFLLGIVSLVRRRPPGDEASGRVEPSGRFDD